VGGFQLGFELPQPDVSVDRVLHGRTIERRRLLRHLCDAPMRGKLGVAFVGVQLVAQQSEQARLAGAIGADEADPFAGVQGQVGAFEQRLRAAPESELREADQALVEGDAKALADLAPLVHVGLDQRAELLRRSGRGLHSLI
jgi:hypothetical protein